jgi:GGDEF domain-containing protein
MATFVVVKVGAPALLACLVAATAGIAALAQTLVPGFGIDPRTSRWFAQGRLYRRMIERQHSARLVEESSSKPDTGALNNLDQRFRQLRAAQARYGHDFALVLLTVDDLEREGATASELVPVVLRRLRDAVRATDTAAQVDATSFAVLVSLEHGVDAELYAAGARLVNAVARESADGPALSISLGVAMRDAPFGLGELLQHAREETVRGRATGHVGYTPRRFSRRFGVQHGPEPTQSDDR